MIDTDLIKEIASKEAEETVFKTLKKYGVIPSTAIQTTLIQDEVYLEHDMMEFMKDKQCLVWLGSNEKGAEQGVKCNQFYVTSRGSMKVEMVIPLYFEEVFNIWEAYFKGNSLEDIFFTVIFEEENVGLSDLRLVIWALIHGKCNYALKFIREDRYDFDFKKYEGRY